MSVEIDIHLGEEPVQAIPVPATSGSVTLLTGRGHLCGWALRDVSGTSGGTSEGSTAAPAAGTTITTITALPAGTYDVTWDVQLAGTPAGGDANNFEILHNAVVLAASVNLGAVGDYPQGTFPITVAQGDSITIKNIGAGTAGTTYTASLDITATDVPSAVAEIVDIGNIIGEVAPLPGSADTQEFGSDGIKIRGQIKINVIRGMIQGVVYARYYC